MKYIQLISMFLICLLFTNCNNNNNKITQPTDYNAYLDIKENISLKKTKEDFSFWKNKIEKTPNQYPYYSKLAAANSKIFQLTGNIEELKKAEENLLILNKKTNYNNTSSLRDLARNYISQHRFKEALELLIKAEYLGEKLEVTHYMLIDVYLELGNLNKVEKYLSKVKNFKNFDYLIRVSKYNDHIGNLDKAIEYLEASLEIAKSSKNNYLIQWNYTNLADYYGHAGRIKDSYTSYLKALNLNSNNSYAKKGIAWIVYSFERNPVEALRILNSITKENASPDYHLFKAEIEEYMGNFVEKEKYINKYLSKVSNDNYGVMYAKNNVLLFADDNLKKEEALAIAKKEVLERPTAQSYDLLAWSYYKKGNVKKALEVVENYVLNNTFEPEILLHTAHILKANGKLKEANKIKKELLEAVYELGPLSEKEIRNI